MLSKCLVEGKKIYLRKLTDTDVRQEYCQWLNNPEVNKYLESRFYTHTLESIKEFVSEKENKDDEIIFAIVLKDNDKHIGNIKIGPINKEHGFADIGLLIGDKSCWGKGIATEAIKLVVEYGFNKLNLHKLTAGCYSENIGSIKAFEKNNFKKEGILKEQYFCNNCYLDGIILGIVNKNYKS